MIFFGSTLSGQTLSGFWHSGSHANTIIYRTKFFIRGMKFKRTCCGIISNSK